MRILFACGGTGGHINPALAVAGYLKENYKDTEIAFAGNPNGMEKRLVGEAGYDFYPVHVSGFNRKINLENIAHNVGSAVKALTSTVEAGSIITSYKPDVVMGTGGYVSGPVVRKAHKMGIKTAAHEQNAYPGITTKMLSKYVDAVMLAMPEARKFLPERKYYDTGNPVRVSVLKGDRAASRKSLGINDADIMILSFGGSLGAEKINESMAAVIGQNAGINGIVHYHATGRGGAKEMPAMLKKNGIENINDYENIHITEYISNMDVLLPAADLVISRAGAISLSEIEVQGKASILIPSPNVAENHQFHNAMTLKNRNAAIVIEEKDLSPQSLLNEISALTSNPMRLYEMGKNASSAAVFDSNERIAAILMKLSGK